MSSRDRLKKVFADTLSIPADAAVEKLTYNQTTGWDSVGHMRLVAALETEFGVLLETDQILDLRDFNQGLEILKAHGITN